MNYQEQPHEGRTILWDMDENIGIRFTPGQKWQRESYEITCKDYSIISTEEGVERLNKIVKRLVEEASRRYPEEFKELIYSINQTGKRIK